MRLQSGVGSGAVNQRGQLCSDIDIACEITGLTSSIFEVYFKRIIAARCRPRVRKDCRAFLWIRYSL